MTNNKTPLDQLKGFLNQLFQFDSQDLDFGVYKILHYKRKEIANFIDQLLVDKVKEQLQTLSADEAKHIKEQVANLEKDDIIKGWLESEDDAEKKVLEKVGKDKINLYKELKAKATEATVSVETENQIYNHLTLFFSRYYDKGDFISKRRFGKNEKYMVPYNGEETHFHWANHDQYYIKSSETFQQYAFKISTHLGIMVINFKLIDAQLEQGNVKADEPNFFILSEKNAEIMDNESKFFFEYRPLNAAEKKDLKGNNKQDLLNESAFEKIKANCTSNVSLAELWKKDKDGKDLLLKKLQHYTRKNNYDFFIHKNLKGFLERELDYYIKTELINVDDLYVTDADTHFDRLKHNLKIIKVFKIIADTIIDFVSQIEDFQKKLWEKKKFVLSTEWVITIDRLVEYIGEEAVKPILKEVIKNENQVAEWKELFGEKFLPKNKDDFKADLHTWRKLPVDTKYFDVIFKSQLINEISLKINIHEQLDGFLQKSDNYHGLQLIQESYSSQINPIYVDPPYNTDASAIIYKNNYKSSSFLSLMDQRIKLSENLLRDDSMICVAIDDVEVLGLRKILGEYYFKEVGIVAVRSNPAGRKTKGKFSPAHEYALFFGKSSLAIPKSLEITSKRLDRYPEKDSEGNFAWANFIRSGTGDKKEDRPTMYFPIYVDDKDNIRVPELEYVKDSPPIVHEQPAKNETAVWPITRDNGKEIHKRWQRGFQRVIKEVNEYRVRRTKDGLISIDFKTRMDENSLPITWWDKKEYASANYGAAELKDLFDEKPFDFPKARRLVYDCLRVSGALDSQNSITLDFFPGSGTTFHAVQVMNKEDNAKRKCILIEQGHYFHTVIIPRIKKVAYTYNWKTGKPKDGSMNGLGIFFKYQRLEQYEEALENIAFSASEDAMQKALQFNQYIPKYFLEFETKGSKTFVNTAAMQDPWDYKLKVWDGYTYNTEQAVDLVETFNYLIGLHMQKCITKEINDTKYQFIIGHNNANKQITVVWRSVKGWKIDNYKADAIALKEELKAFTYDLLYINNQAHIEGYQPIEEVFKNKMLS